MTSMPRSYCTAVPLTTIVILGIIACGPGSQVLEQQRHQINANQQLIEENRRLIKTEKDRRAQQQQRAYEALEEENRRLILAEAKKDDLAQQQQRAYEALEEENRRLILAEQDRLAGERQSAQDQQSDTADTLTQPDSSSHHTAGTSQDRDPPEDSSDLTPTPGRRPATPARQIGETFQDCEACPQMVVVPAGSFMMGSPSDEAERRESEGPQHQVTISQPFAVGMYEVTFAEWDACVSDGGCNGYRPDDEGWGREQRPVIYVNWEDTQAYMRWLSQHTGQPYRFLSEAEWEYAARAGSTTPFHFGESISPSQANYNGHYTYGGGERGQYRNQTVPVGSFGANEFGLYEVHGNVWGWVQDCWNKNYNGAPSDARAWETGSCGRRILRGGPWSYTPQDLRSANRYGIASDLRINSAGFRVARPLHSSISPDVTKRRGFAVTYIAGRDCDSCRVIQIINRE